MKKNNAVYLIVLAALLPVLLLRDYTPSNELRYLSIVDEALREGSFFAFTNQGVPYADKPPLYFWAIMLGRWLFGGHCMAFLSLFSLIPAFVITRVMDRWTAGALSGQTRSTGRWMMLSCGLFLGMMIILRQDMLMCMFIVLALRSFYRMLTGEGRLRREQLLFPLYVFLAIFSKGPVGILVPLVGTVVYLLLTRRIRTIGRYWGWRTWGILLLLCGAWFGCVYAEGGADYLDNLLFHQTLDRAVNAFHHEEPFYFYAVSIWYSMFPWSLLAIGTIAVALWRGVVCTEQQRFFLTIAAVTFVMLSAISSKIDVYLLPAFPFVLYLTLLVSPDLRWNRWQAAAVAVPAVVFCLVLPAVIVLARLEDTRFVGQVLFYAAATLLSAAGATALYRLYGRRRLDTAIRTIACGLFAAVFVGGWALPKINGEIGYGELCRTSMQVAAQRNLSGYCVCGVSRPEGMDVYLGEDVRIVSWEEIAAGELHGTVLMLPVRSLGELEKNVPTAEVCDIVGRYAVVALS